LLILFGWLAGFALAILLVVLFHAASFVRGVFILYYGSDVEDVIVCGGGMAGLAAAVWLGRYRRQVVVVDAGRPRNRAAERSHGYLTRDGISPDELLAAAREDAEKYPTINFLAGEAKRASKAGDGFIVDAGVKQLEAKRLVLATGVTDEFPDIPGFEQLYGTHIFHCACCDGYESSDLEVLAIGWGEHVAGFALDLLEWGAKVRVVTNGNTFEGDEACRNALQKHDIDLIEETVQEFHVDDDAMRGVRLGSGEELSAQRAFFSIAHHPRSDIARELGCDIDELGYVEVGAHGETSVDGVYAAGDLTPGEQMVQVASAKGAVAGIACAMSLRGSSTPSAAPDPGPDPEEELSG
jgi:thioredoxin reductase